MIKELVWNILVLYVLKWLLLSWLLHKQKREFSDTNFENIKLAAAPPGEIKQRHFPREPNSVLKSMLTWTFFGMNTCWSP